MVEDPPWLVLWPPVDIEEGRRQMIGREKNREYRRHRQEELKGLVLEISIDELGMTQS